MTRACVCLYVRVFGIRWGEGRDIKETGLTGTSFETAQHPHAPQEAPVLKAWCVASA